MPLRVNLESMSDMELHDHILAFQKEQQRRANVQREADWKVVCDAIKNYSHKYGNIEVVDYEADETTMYVGGHWDFSTIGRIEA